MPPTDGRSRLIPATTSNAVTALLATIVLASCGGTPAATPSPSAPAGTLVTAAAGGTVTSDDGQARLIVPAGALAADTYIDLKAVPAAELTDDVVATQPLGTVYDAQPDGLTFSASATLEMDHTSSALDAARDADSFLVPMGRSRTAGGTIEDVLDTTTSVDLGTGTATTSMLIDHLSWQWSSLNHQYVVSFGVAFPDGGFVGDPLIAPGVIINNTSNTIFANGTAEGHGALQMDPTTAFQGQAVEIASQVPVTFNYGCGAEGVGSATARLRYAANPNFEAGLGFILNQLNVMCRKRPATPPPTAPPAPDTPSPSPAANFVTQMDANFPGWRDGLEGRALYSMGTCEPSQFESGGRLSLVGSEKQPMVEFEQLAGDFVFNLLQGLFRGNDAYLADNSTDFDELLVIGLVPDTDGLRILGGNWGANEQALADVIAQIRAGNVEGYEGVLAAIEAGDFDGAALLLFGPLGPPSGTCFHLLELLFEE